MSKILTADKLISSLKRRAMIPSDQNTFTPEDFLEILNEEISVFALPHLLSTHEEYLLRFEDVAVVTGQTAYTIPYRAIGNKLKDIQYVDSNNTIFELSRIKVDDLHDYNNSELNNFPHIFYVQDNKIHLVDGFPTSGIIRMYFYLRPNDLVLEKNSAVITDINRTTGVITISGFQDDFALLGNLDFVQARTPNKLISYDIVPTSVDSNTSTVTFDPDDIPTDLVLGDYLNFAGQSSVPQIPTELHPLIAQRVAVHCLEALGDTEGVQVAQARLKLMEQATLDLIDNRVEGAGEKVVNRHSPLRQTIQGFYRTGRR